MTDTFPRRLTTDSSGKGTLAVNRSKFGDGYSQHLAKGLNSDEQTWTVNFTGRKVDAQVVVDFIRAHPGQSFFWKPPFSNVPLYWTCDEYDMKPVGGDIYDVGMTFVQTYYP